MPLPNHEDSELPQRGPPNLEPRSGGAFWFEERCGTP
uniref:Uncharacterized protein n=1 Tax=Arundo donax TaxID=35708 RepID=A0A0A8YUQ7_ARUDO